MEKGCAILEAVEDGTIDEDAYANFRKMEKEKKHFALDAQALRKKDKNMGKMIKRILKEKKKYKY